MCSVHFFSFPPVKLFLVWNTWSVRKQLLHWSWFSSIKHNLETKLDFDWDKCHHATVSSDLCHLLLLYELWFPYNYFLFDSFWLHGRRLEKVVHYVSIAEIHTCHVKKLITFSPNEGLILEEKLSRLKLVYPGMHGKHRVIDYWLKNYIFLSSLPHLSLLLLLLKSLRKI